MAAIAKCTKVICDESASDEALELVSSSLTKEDLALIYGQIEPHQFIARSRIGNMLLSKGVGRESIPHLKSDVPFFKKSNDDLLAHVKTNDDPATLRVVISILQCRRVRNEVIEQVLNGLKEEELNYRRLEYEAMDDASLRNVCKNRKEACIELLKRGISVGELAELLNEPIEKLFSKMSEKERWYIASSDTFVCTDELLERMTTANLLKLCEESMTRGVDCTDEKPVTLRGVVGVLRRRQVKSKILDQIEKELDTKEEAAVLNYKNAEYEAKDDKSLTDICMKAGNRFSQDRLNASIELLKRGYSARELLKLLPTIENIKEIFSSMTEKALWYIVSSATFFCQQELLECMKTKNLLKLFTETEGVTKKNFETRKVIAAILLRRKAKGVEKVLKEIEEEENKLDYKNEKNEKKESLEALCNTSQDRFHQDRKSACVELLKGGLSVSQLRKLLPPHESKILTSLPQKALWYIVTSETFLGEQEVLECLNTQNLVLLCGKKRKDFATLKVIVAILERRTGKNPFIDEILKEIEGNQLDYKNEKYEVMDDGEKINASVELLKQEMVPPTMDAKKPPLLPEVERPTLCKANQFKKTSETCPDQASKNANVTVGALGPSFHLVAGEDSSEINTRPHELDEAENELKKPKPMTELPKELSPSLQPQHALNPVTAFRPPPKTQPLLTSPIIPSQVQVYQPVQVPVVIEPVTCLQPPSGVPPILPILYGTLQQTPVQPVGSNRTPVLPPHLTAKDSADNSQPKPDTTKAHEKRPADRPNLNYPKYQEPKSTTDEKLKIDKKTLPKIEKEPLSKVNTLVVESKELKKDAKIKDIRGSETSLYYKSKDELRKGKETRTKMRSCSPEKIVKGFVDDTEACRQRARELLRIGEEMLKRKIEETEKALKEKPLQDFERCHHKSRELLKKGEELLLSKKVEVDTKDSDSIKSELKIGKEGPYYVDSRQSSVALDKVQTGSNVEKINSSKETFKPQAYNVDRNLPFYPATQTHADEFGPPDYYPDHHFNYWGIDNDRETTLQYVVPTEPVEDFNQYSEERGVRTLTYIDTTKSPPKERIDSSKEDSPPLEIVKEENVKSRSPSPTHTYDSDESWDDRLQENKDQLHSAVESRKRPYSPQNTETFEPKVPKIASPVLPSKNFRVILTKEDCNEPFSGKDLEIFETLLVNIIQFTGGLPPLIEETVRTKNKLIISCANEYSQKWLLQYVPRLKLDGVPLCAVKEEPVSPSFELVFPPTDKCAAELFKMLEVFNFWLDASQWVVLSSIHRNGNRVFTVTVPEKSANYFKDCEYKLFFGLQPVIVKPL